MVWGAIAGGLAAGAASSLLGSDAASDAAKDASKNQWNMYNQTRSDLDPWRTGGLNAMNAYDQALGLGGSYANQPMSIGEWTKLNPMSQSPSLPQTKGVDRYGPGGNTQDAMNARTSGKRWDGSNWVSKSQPSAADGYQNYLSNFDRGEYTPSQRQQTPMYGPFQAPEGSELPQWGGSEPWKFNLEDDEIYNFALDEGLKGATRQMNAQKMSNSGGILAELQRRGNLFAADYQDRAHARQLGDSRENQNRALTDYGLGTDYANSLYGRGVDEYGMDVGRNKDIYGRDQDYLNRLSMRSGSGQNAAAQMGGFGANAAATAGQLGLQGGLADQQGWQGLNNAVQGSISNYLTHDLLQNNPYAFGGYGGYQSMLGGNAFAGGDLGSGYGNPFGGGR